MSYIDIAVLVSSLGVGGLMFAPRVMRWTLWRASATPLASIIGSGFLVVGPILVWSFGLWATPAMALLCLIAWGFGAAIRFNIRHAEGVARSDDRWVWAMERTASFSLSLAYVISVAYYLNLFGAFGVSLTPWRGADEGRVLTTLMIALILGIGWTRGFSALERAEIWAVSLKLAVIAGLVGGLALYFGEVAAADGLIAEPARLAGLPALTLLFGLIVTVQGFETSRYLGEAYSAETRVKSMRFAQLIATGIYVVYVLFMSTAIPVTESGLTETMIIDLMRVVAPVLPLLLVAAALAAQFSAAVADTNGAEGLFHELSEGRVGPRGSYILLAVVGVTLTWGLDIFAIISVASRAFALYYAIQSMIAARLALKRGARAEGAVFAVMALIGLAAAAFGTPAEGGPQS